MRETNWNRRYFRSTRGRVLRLLCTARRTVSDLAARLGLTDNAVRAHLAALGRDGLVRPSGLRAGVRRPNVEYDLTPAGHQFFPKAYGPALARLLDVLGERMPAAAARDLVREAAARLAAEYLSAVRDADPRWRLQKLSAVLMAAGVTVEVEREGGDGAAVVRGCSCPLATVVSSHPELCGPLAGVLAELLGRHVVEQCEKGPSPRCRFRVAADSTAAAAERPAGRS